MPLTCCIWQRATLTPHPACAPPTPRRPTNGGGGHIKPAHRRLPGAVASTVEAHDTKKHNTASQLTAAPTAAAGTPSKTIFKYYKQARGGKRTAASSSKYCSSSLWSSVYAWLTRHSFSLASRAGNTISSSAAASGREWGVRPREVSRGEAGRQGAGWQAGQAAGRQASRVS